MRACAGSDHNFLYEKTGMRRILAAYRFFAWCFGYIRRGRVVLVEVHIAKGGILCYNLLDKVALLCPDEEKEKYMPGICLPAVKG